MTRRKPAGLVTLVTLLALTLMGCKGDNGPTGWVPRDGSVTGAVTVTNSSLLPLNSTPDLAAAPGKLTLPLPAALDELRARSLGAKAALMGAGGAPPQHPSIA